MWIRTQDKQRIINSDRIATVYVSNTGGKIMAVVEAEKGLLEYALLGDYKNRDICIKILDDFSSCAKAGLPIFEMPLGGEV